MSSKLVSSILGVSGAYGMGIPLLVLANAVLARSLSLADFGSFAVLISVATVLAIPVSNGLTILLTREVARASQGRDWGLYQGAVQAANRWVIVAGGLISLSVLTANILGLDHHGLTQVAALVPVIGLASVDSATLKGLGRPVPAEYSQQVIQPILLVLGYLALRWTGRGSLDAMLWWYVIAVALTAVHLKWRRCLAEHEDQRRAAPCLRDLPSWRRALIPFTLTGAATVISAQAAVLLLGAYGLEQAAAEMRVAERGGQIVALPLLFANSVIGPHFVAALRSRSEELIGPAVRATARKSAQVTFVVSLAAGVLLVVWGEPILELAFGHPYGQRSYMPMTILVGGQVISVALGSGGILLAMGGRESQVLVAMALSLGLTAAVGAVLVPTLGAIGAALGVSVGILASKTYAYLAVRRWLRVSPGIL